MNIPRKWIAILAAIVVVVIAADAGFVFLHSPSRVHVAIISKSEVVQATGQNVSKGNGTSQAGWNYPGYNSSKEGLFVDKISGGYLDMVSLEFNTTAQAHSEYANLTEKRISSQFQTTNDTYNSFTYSYVSSSGTNSGSWAVWGIYGKYVFNCQASKFPAKNSSIKAVTFDEIDVMG